MAYLTVPDFQDVAFRFNQNVFGLKEETPRSVLYTVTPGAPTGHFDRRALFVNALHLISHILRLLFIYHSLLPRKISDTLKN